MKRDRHIFTCEKCQNSVIVLADPDYDPCPMVCCYLDSVRKPCNGELLMTSSSWLPFPEESKKEEEES